MIRLIALDMDGTLLNSRGVLSERNRQAICAAREQGARVALVTGRRFRDARPLALELGLDVPVISHNGALTKHARTLETVAASLLPLEAALTALAVGRAHDADALVSDDPAGAGLLLYDHIHAENKPVAEYIAWARRIHGDEAEAGIRHVPSLEEYLDHAPVHLSFTGAYAPMRHLHETLLRELDTSVKIMGTFYPHKDFALLDLIHPEASKGVGLAAVAAEYQVTPAEVMAVGDNLNDMEMLHYAGTGVAMANAEPPLREIEGIHVTATNDEDGVALAIERFVLTSQK